MITEDILLDKMIEAGACDGLDKKSCIKSIKLVFKFGDAKISLVKAIMGHDFDRFADNYRAAIDKITSDSEQITDSGDEPVTETTENGDDSFYGEIS